MPHTLSPFARKSIRTCHPGNRPGGASNGKACRLVRMLVESSLWPCRLLSFLLGLKRYPLWAVLYDSPPPARGGQGPGLAVIIHGRTHVPSFMEASLASLAGQSEPLQELAVTYRTGNSPRLGSLPSGLALHLVPGPQNSGSWRINASLEDISAPFVLFLDAGDRLHPHALALLRGLLDRRPEAILISTDEDLFSAREHRSSPLLLPGWNPELSLSRDTFTGACVYSLTHIRAVGGLDVSLNHAPLYDLGLRVGEIGRTDQLLHLPEILLHRRIPDPVAHQAQPGHWANVVQHRIDRTGADGLASPLPHAHGCRTTFHLPSPHPSVSLVIPCRNQAEHLKACVESLLERTSYHPLEIVVVDNHSTDGLALDHLDRIRSHPSCRVERVPGPFNLSALLNRGAAVAHGTVLGFLSPLVRAGEQLWLEEIASQTLRPEVGAAGPLLVTGKGHIHASGLILGMGDVASHAFAGLEPDDPRQSNLLQLSRSVSALPPDCLFVSKDTFRQAGEFDESLALHWHALDFCLRVRRLKLDVITIPHVRVHWAGSTRTRPYGLAGSLVRRLKREETVRMRERWGPALSTDPFHNPNASLRAPGLDLAWPPRERRPQRQ